VLEELRSWREGPAKTAIVDFVARVTDERSEAFVPPAERAAVFDNDGTLWCEKPMQIEVGFMLRRFAEMAEADASLRDKQPWKAAHDRDYDWLRAAVDKHYAGDDSDVQVLIAGLVQSFAGMGVDEYAEGAHEFLTGADHPTLGRLYAECVYQPMLELLRYLESNGFACYIVSGGDRDFMRPVTEQIYGIPAERVVGSASGLAYEPDEDGGRVVYKAELDFFDDGPVKPVRIWSRIGRRPILAAGNSNGDIEMLQYTGGRSRPSLQLLVKHDDAEREFDYVAGAEKVLEQAAARGWTVISVKNDWAAVFADAAG
jgi:FMN phosphatase YigB (HAD superfamily)